MISEGADNSNGRVTLAVLGAKSDEILRRLDNIDKCQQDHEKRLATIEQVSAKREEQVKTLQDATKEHDAEIEGLKSSDRKWGVASGFIAAIIGGLVSFFKP